MDPILAPHFIIFPFMSRGHTIPLLYLGRLLRQRSVAVTIITTAGNSPCIRDSLRDTDIKIVELPFPKEINGVPPGVESTDKLPSMACFLPFANSTKLMQQDFEDTIQTLEQSATCIISDIIFGWTQKSAAKFGIPRLVFSGMGIFSTTMYQILYKNRPHAGTVSLDTPFLIPDFPKLKLTRNDFEPPFCEIEPTGEFADFMVEQSIALEKSDGLIVNGFYELESIYVDYWNQKFGPKAWCVGPLRVAKPQCTTVVEKPLHMQWLDGKFAEGEPVLYVSFGTQAKLSSEQLNEIAMGLENSQASCLWVLRSEGVKYLPGFEKKVKKRVMIVKEWVDQMEILNHKAVKGFLSHCGWNSVMESLSANVPILAFPMMAEQHLNARLLVEEIGVGLRILPSNGSVRGFVEAREVEKMVKELMGGEKGKALRQKVEEIREAACAATVDGGSSWHSLNFLIDDVCGKRFSQIYSRLTKNEEVLACPLGQDILEINSK
ncbi:UDP-glycosyltransferase 90A1-like [Olea europaea var. sylvestris]|uniref:UDP-glycosyltransferase 90A1-like n=1 Tax=Olea europaea var. sylvestris TaxID=158386 RepID=UPI000C1D1323|nr:UDP-glycosyltransferase 90A1-like [Olea europaea var. sylvestris]